jgi:hypothetical protein
MGNKAKTAASIKGATVQIKNDYEGYKRFGYRLPGGLTVVSSSPIADLNQPAGADPVLLPINFIDSVPVSIPESINWDHLGDVITFGVVEKSNRDFDRQAAADRKALEAVQVLAAAVGIIGQEAFDTLIIKAGEGELTEQDMAEIAAKMDNGDADEICKCDDCEGHCIPDIGSDGEFVYPNAKECETGPCTAGLMPGEHCDNCGKLCADDSYDSELGAYKPDPGDDND